MPAILRTDWSGTSGGPGLTQIALLGAAGGIWNPDATQAAVNAMRAFWDAFKGNLPDELRLTVNPVIDDYDTNTGELVNSWTAPIAPTAVNGTSAAAYAAGAGTKIVWNTGQIRNGRRVKGSTFIVPLASTVYGTNGMMAPGTITTMNLAATNLLAALSSAGCSMGVWSRPRELPTPRAGYATQVIAGTCSQKTAILRGRRD